MMRFLLHLFAFAALLGGLITANAQASTDEEGDAYRALAQLDQRLFSVGYRLAVANSDYCPHKAMSLGLAWQDRAQYGAAGQAALGLSGDISVAAIAADAPETARILRVGDTLRAINGVPLTLPDPPKKPTVKRLHQAEAMLDTAMAQGTVALTLDRAGQGTLSVALIPQSLCATRFQIESSGVRDAWADGTGVAITSALTELTQSDDALAAIAAHEMAHNMLDHAARLRAVGVKRGLLTQLGVGKSDRQIRMTEEEADRLSVWLLANAGYDRERALSFWQLWGRDAAWLTAPTHYRMSSRVAMMREEWAAVDAAPRDAAGHVAPPLLIQPHASLR